MTLLVRGKHVICKVIDRDHALIIDDGALAIEGGVIIDRGRFDELVRRYPTDDILGSAAQVVMPGLVNSHHHVGLTPFQLGSPDLPLELWAIRRRAARNVDSYLDTLYSGFEMVESGVTTVQHLHRGLRGDRADWHRSVGDVLRAYSDIGMRVTHTFSISDRNRFVYVDDEAFIQTLPSDLVGQVQGLVPGTALPAEELFTFFDELWERYARNQSSLLKLQLAPANPVWCSDETLIRARTYADKYGTRLHIHVLESLYQREHARREYGETAVRHLRNLGILGPHTTLAHAVWITNDDADLLADSGTYVCHNATSNLRLSSGVAPLEQLIAKRVPVALGIDEAGINDDRDMLQEMRMVLNLHHAVEAPGQFTDPVSANQVLQMATEGGANSTGYGREIGILEPGRSADLVLIDWNAIAEPYLEPGIPIVDAIVRRARPPAVRTVLVAGQVVLRDGRFTRIDKQRAMEDLARTLRYPRTPAEAERIALADALLPYVRRFYEGWLSSETRPPRRESVKSGNAQMEEGASMSGVHVTNMKSAPSEQLDPPARGFNRLLLKKNEVGSSKTLDIIHWTFVDRKQGVYHLHEHSDNVMMCLKGTLEMVVDDLRYVFREGDIIYIPAGIPHSSGNGGDEPSEGIELYAPARARGTDAVPVPGPTNVRDAPITSP